MDAGRGRGALPLMRAVKYGPYLKCAQLIALQKFVAAERLTGCFCSLLISTSSREGFPTGFLPSVKPTHADVTPFMMSVAHMSFYGAPANFYYFENKRLRETMTLISFELQGGYDVILVRGRVETLHARNFSLYI